MTTKVMRVCAVVLVLAAAAVADVYMHNPRGSNNRLNERSANRNNGNRMFDSQNNNRGGYNKGDRYDDVAFDQYDEQYDMEFYMSAPDHLETGEGQSVLTVEWTNQHGCGGNELGDPHKLNCQIVLQYMCMPEYQNAQTGAQDRFRADCSKECFIPIESNPTCDLDKASPCPRIELEQAACDAANFLWLDAQVDDEFNCPDGGGEYAPRDLRMRDGLNTNRQDYTNAASGDTQATRAANKGNNVKADRGLHESWEWYDECYRRERNRGLFTADQNLRNNNLGYSSAVFTRQNPNNNRRGYECPEERDYWPYWHPSPWVDIAIMTDRLDLCPFYQENSQNVKSKHLCRNTDACPRCVRFNNEAQCVANQGRWVEVGAHNVPAPECIQAPWSRVNHLGNGRYGQANSYNWTLPYVLAGYDKKNAGGGNPTPFTSNYRNPTAYSARQRCVLRLRYNISTDDYDAYMVNASFNNNDGQGIKSPVRQNPNINIGAASTALRLAINTAQFGRTFQDRSHVFVLKPRETGTNVRVRSDALTRDDFWTKAGNKARTVYNINVRGKRGNIVQTFPSVEYDFMPNQLHVSDEDIVHFQWTGSNTHNNGNPAGDGQAGDAGEGQGGTDRHNVVELRRRNFGESFPATWEESTMFKNMLDAYSHEYAVSEANAGKTWEEVKRDWALRMASAGYYKDLEAVEAKRGKDDQNGNPRNGKLDKLLNNAPPAFHGGLFRFKKGEYNYMCTRNHNFSNRDQKGVLIVENTLSNTLSNNN